MLKQVIHILLAITVFFSSAGILVNEHFCQDSYVGTSFMFDMGSCGCTSSCCSASTDVPKDSESSNCSHNKDKKNCCHTEYTFAKIDQTQQVNKCEVKDFEFKIVWHAPNYAYQLFTENQIFKHLIGFLYTPPLIVFDPQIQLETFLC